MVLHALHFSQQPKQKVWICAALFGKHALFGKNKGPSAGPGPSSQPRTVVKPARGEQ
jgi:hypothetical protein